jgi:hypothetical protein
MVVIIHFERVSKEETVTCFIIFSDRKPIKMFALRNWGKLQIP